jgi:toxin ParE1/3/4
VKVRILTEAVDEIDSAREYLNLQSPELGLRFLDDLDGALQEISRNPESFPKLETLPDDQPYRRVLLRTFRYIVVFEVLADEVVVVAVAHASRKPNYWLDRTN